MSINSDYLQHHQTLLEALYDYCLTQLPFSSEQASDVDREFIATFKSLCLSSNTDADYSFNGQSIITRIVSHYQHITPSVSRDLFWYFGGDCLHYMTDEETALYQQLEETLYEQDNISYGEAKASVFQMH